MRRLFDSLALGKLTYPAHPISIIVPFGEGTTADLICTVVADQITANIGHPVTIELLPRDNGGDALAKLEHADGPRGEGLRCYRNSTSGSPLSSSQPSISSPSPYPAQT
jgi:tripartite-type tricarboxylate transporter receptor subunit TctC